MLLKLLALTLSITGLSPALFAEQATSRPAQHRTAARSSFVCGAGLVTLDGGDLDRTRPHRMDYIVMEPWEAARIPALRRANPKMKILMYQDLSAVRWDRDSSGLASTGLTGQQMRGSWFLHNSAGKRARWADYPELYAANVGKAGYQKAWLKSVLRRLRSAHWDGVMLDDALTTLSHDLVGGGHPREIPTDGAQYLATESALHRIGPVLRHHGYLAMPNITVFWDNWQKPIKHWSKYVSGWENEFLVKWGLTKMERFLESNDWLWKYKMAHWLAKHRKPLVAVTYSNRDDREAQLYHRATWLLTWNGHSGASAFVPYEESVNHVTRLANLALGQPKGAANHRADGAYERVYGRGRVLVNPTSHGITVRLPHALHLPSGKLVHRVRLPSATGRLLFKSVPPKAACS